MNERPLAFAAQFIDDKLAAVLGVIRLIACMCAVWWITDDGNFKLAKPKTRCGQASTELGLQFEWANGRSKQPTDKFIICVEWAERIINLKRISHKELESAVSTLQFGVMGIDNRLTNGERARTQGTSTAHRTTSLGQANLGF